MLLRRALDGLAEGVVGKRLMTCTCRLTTNSGSAETIAGHLGKGGS